MAAQVERPATLPRPLSGFIGRDREIIRCPWYLWESEIATGRCLVAPGARVKTDPVLIENGQVVVDDDPADLPVTPYHP